ncbi:hypothetical protein [Amycolatopsis cihanbeyliensis]|uniref:Uncharacterized protein n=1 Tax=Amycolatopsis cihanbeyliensis TaxID=1128664 RepID=A0A542CSF6_AMYCI|nr:hypothetical protein [Amycolatopsis cihanbeyliensis]TQI93700.1 hypothetical protein FB471_5841 [Amycolatopsis cihanbeyliensis]
MSRQQQNPIPQGPPAEEPTTDPAQRRQAARAVASAARDAEDCARLLDALGLRATDGLDTDTPRHRRRAG